MAAKSLPSQEVLRQLLDYDPETGKLYWKTRTVEWFSSVRAKSLWNALYAGKEAFTTVRRDGYHTGKILGEFCFKHRVVWKLMNGVDPEVIDHISGEKSDDRLQNLASGTKSHNSRNRKKPVNNTSGIMGVSQRSNTSKWIAFIGVGGKTLRLGNFSSFEAAVNARKSAETKYEFHKNHGR